jgi:hypothetical protein
LREPCRLGRGARLAFKIIGAVAGFVAALFLQIVQFSSFLQLVIIALLTFVGFIVPIRC